MNTDNTNELAEAMFQVFRLMKEEMSFVTNVTHLSILQIHTLIFLCHSKEVTMSDIAEHFHVELPSATSLLNKLCDQKLVKRTADENDRRLVKVSLTNQGKVLLKQVMKERKVKLEKVLSYLSVQERKDLLTILKTLQSRLQKKDEN